jgi:CRP/FNR family transcriptional regulator, cyclic AMP receptor protein
LDVAMERGSSLPSFDVFGFLTKLERLPPLNYQEDQTVYSQGDPAESVFYVHKGKVKITVISERGKEAIVAIRGPDEFCGEGALNRTPLRLATATTMSPCEIIRIETETVERLLHANQEFADYFLAHLLTRTARVEADLVDQLFNSTEMRLARALLLLANYGNDVGLEPIAVKVNHDTLAALIGATRGRVNLFMNKFRLHREVVWVIVSRFRSTVFCCCCRCGDAGNALALSICPQRCRTFAL